jgi:hypothetical protein
MKGKTITELIASALIVLFLYAAVMQLAFHQTYLTQFTRSLSKEALSQVVAWTLPLAQLSLGFLLWKNSTRLTGLIGTLVLVSLFTIYLFVMLPAGSRSRCNCGELWQKTSLEVNILFNLAVILLSAVAIIITGRFKTNTPRLT